MKIDIRRIVADHLMTLRSTPESKRVSAGDVFLFYVGPIAISAYLSVTGYRTNKDFHSLSITLFGIFIPLLLNIQVAVFTIFTRARPKIADPKLAASSEERISIRNELLREVNANISYLVLISCIASILFLLFFSSGKNDETSEFLSSFIYIHFFLTLLMITKRAHTLFHKEYDFK